jgi:hypothetical protein
MAARLARRHVARAAWADAGMGVPPQPTPTRLLPSTTMRRVILPPLPKAVWHAPRHPAATAKGGMACHVILPPLPKAAWPTTVTACLCAGLGDGGTPMPALAQAARATCRLAKRAATRRGSFLIKFFAGGLF